jgi:hypothetical protein
MKILNQNTKINLELIATISGYSFGELKEKAKNAKGEEYLKTVLDDNKKPVLDTSKVQIQTISFAEDGEILRNTFKLNKEIAEDKMKTLQGKTFKFEGVMEHEIATEGSDFKNKTYSAKEIGQEVKSEETVFSANKTLIAFIDNVVEKEVKDRTTKKITSYNTVFQIVSMNGTKMDVKNIKLKDERADKYKALKGKKVIFDNIKIFAGSGKVYFSTEEIPKEVK